MIKIPFTNKAVSFNKNVGICNIYIDSIVMIVIPLMFAFYAIFTNEFKNWYSLYCFIACLICFMSQFIMDFKVVRIGDDKTNTNSNIELKRAVYNLFWIFYISSTTVYFVQKSKFGWAIFMFIIDALYVPLIVSDIRKVILKKKNNEKQDS